VKVPRVRFTIGWLMAAIAFTAIVTATGMAALEALGPRSRRPPFGWSAVVLSIVSATAWVVVSRRTQKSRPQVTPEPE
jgi:hypothetical protein